ncbi:putative RNA binding protein [Quillaja saponaria]|uniref:RNA binding protein n=1 Tax=Quillaja saponaria TaxID=32244 RepID=A0AAD7PVJ0_QUISA|nr:putative RNA binding protein [Quillaja saponaria]
MQASVTMWATMVSFPCHGNPQAIFRRTRKRFTNHKSSSVKLRASLFDYPLASRIIVKNLPYSTSETSLQKVFSNFGEVAEVKVVKDAATKKSKGYAFIQYISQEDAMLALETMDQKNLDGRMICVDIAKPGKEAFGGTPRTSGPPKKWHLAEHEEVADCWY